MKPVLLLLALLLPVPALADCPLDLGHGTGWVVFSEHYMIAFRPDPLRIETNEPLALVLNVCTKDGEAAELVAVSASNLDVQGPEQHLKIVPGAQGQGRYRAEGLMLSTIGRWEIDFDVRSGKESERLEHEIIVK
jgi:hypothetical protein